MRIASLESTINSIPEINVGLELEPTTLIFELDMSPYPKNKFLSSKRSKIIGHKGRQTHNRPSSTSGNTKMRRNRNLYHCIH